MKFQVQMKDPDTLDDAICDAVNTQLRSSGLSDEEQDLISESRRAKVNELCAKWFAYGEYLTVEIDTEAGTCVVVANQ